MEELTDNVVDTRRDELRLHLISKGVDEDLSSRISLRVRDHLLHYRPRMEDIAHFLYIGFEWDESGDGDKEQAREFWMDKFIKLSNLANTAGGNK